MNDNSWESFLIIGKSELKYEIEDFTRKIKKFYHDSLIKNGSENKKNQKEIESKMLKVTNPYEVIKNIKMEAINEAHDICNF